MNNPPKNDAPDKAFVREERYIVIKRKNLTAAQDIALHGHMDRLAIRTVACVVVERDWPEYETVWKMIEARCTKPVERSPNDGAEYRKIATIRAVQWWQMGDHPAVVLKSDPLRYADEGIPWIETLEGGHVVTPGDWIATGVNGEHWPIKPDVFAKTYELAALASNSPVVGEEAQKPTPPSYYRAGKLGSALSFEGGVFFVNVAGFGASDGDALLSFKDDDLDWDEEDYRSIRIPNSELIAIRDELNKWFPPKPIPTDTADRQPVPLNFAGPETQWEVAADRREALVAVLDKVIGDDLAFPTDTLRTANKCADAIASLIAGPLPEGFVMVPVEPTEAMCVLGDMEMNDHPHNAASVWSAMIAGSPENR